MVIGRSVSPNMQNSKLKVLLDENLSHSIIANFKKQFVDFSHVYFENLKSASDIDIWDYAQKNGFDVIVTIDNDFKDIAEVKTMELILKKKNISAPDLSKQPFVIHVSQVDGDHDRVVRMFNKHANPLIAEIVKKPRYNAYLELKDNNFYSKSVSEIFNRYANGAIRAQGKLVQYENAHVNYNMLNTKRNRVGLPDTKR
jgi:predicted nuclease of predicted toxin-antitoxin system